jgi:kinesin family protein 5
MKSNLLRDLQSRCEKVIDLELLLDEAREQYQNVLVRSTSQTRVEKKYLLLERNLEELSQAHHKAMTQNQKLRTECDLAEKKIEAKDKRVVQLEQKLTHHERESLQQIQKLQSQIRELRSSIQLMKKTNDSMEMASGHRGGRVAKPLRGGGGGKEEDKKGFFGFFGKKHEGSSRPTSSSSVVT